MSELKKCLVSNSFAAPPEHILEGVDETLAHAATPGAPHTIYEELWHIAFWQEMSLEWVRGVERAYAEHASIGFPTLEQIAAEPWAVLRARFFVGMRLAGEYAEDASLLERVIRCPSPGGAPVRVMTARGQLESLAGHNGYHFGRIVLLRQLQGAWPPPSGGDTW
jgi:hypothetical protein